MTTPQALGRPFRIWSYFMAGLALAAIIALYWLELYVQAWMNGK